MLEIQPFDLCGDSQGEGIWLTLTPLAPSCPYGDQWWAQSFYSGYSRPDTCLLWFSLITSFSLVDSSWRLIVMTISPQVLSVLASLTFLSVDLGVDFFSPTSRTRRGYHISPWNSFCPKAYESWAWCKSWGCRIDFPKLTSQLLIEHKVKYISW